MNGFFSPAAGPLFANHKRSLEETWEYRNVMPAYPLSKVFIPEKESASVPEVRIPEVRKRVSVR